MKFWKLSLKIGAFEIKLKFWILKLTLEIENLKIIPKWKPWKLDLRKELWAIKLWEYRFWKLNLKIEKKIIIIIINEWINK